MKTFEGEGRKSKFINGMDVKVVNNSIGLCVRIRIKKALLEKHFAEDSYDGKGNIVNVFAIPRKEITPGGSTHTVLLDMPFNSETPNLDENMYQARGFFSVGEDTAKDDSDYLPPIDPNYVKPNF
jgi:hypothetical protein